MIYRELRVPWSSIDKIEKIHMIMEKIQIQTVHTFREANQLVHSITNTTINQENRKQYHRFKDLPSIKRKIINMDKQQYQQSE